MPTRRTPPPAPQPAQLTLEHMRRGITRLDGLIADIEALDVGKLQKRSSSEVKALEQRIRGVLDSVFGHGTVQNRRYISAAELDNGPWHVVIAGFGRERDEGADAREYVAEGKRRSVALLGEAKRWLQDEIDNAEPVAANLPASEVSGSNDVFIVHGHDGEAREAVARFVGILGLNPVVLHEQANMGMTIIEKVEAHGSAAGFAIVLLTPDDKGGKAGETVRPRPRQNVVMELGYFIGKLGRPRVCALATTRDMELPSDMSGIVCETFDNDNPAWKMSLARELQAAGCAVDWNKVMR